MELGVGSARSDQHGLIVVARYSPMGSTGGPSAFIENVHPTSKFHGKNVVKALNEMKIMSAS